MKIKVLVRLSTFFIAVLWSLLAVDGQAQDRGSLRGVVKTQEGVQAEGITVRLKNSQKGALTDRSGRFEVRNLQPGKYTLLISYVGLQNIEKEVEVKAGEVTEVDEIILDEAGTQLSEVVVTAAATKFARKQSEYVARMPLSNLENPQVYSVVPKELFAEQVAVDFKGALLSVPGIANITLGVGSGGTGLAMRMRGFTGADGAGSIRNGMATNFVSLSDPVNLESIEVIKGPSATLFGTTLISYGGLVNRVTKKPFDFQKGEIGYAMGSWGLGRVTFDFNTPLNKEKTFLFRVTGALHREKSFQDFGINKTEMIAPSFSYKVNDRFTIDFDFEVFRSNRNTTYVGMGTPGPSIKNLNDLNWDFKKSYTSDEFTSKSQILNSYTKATYRISDQWTSMTQISFANTENNANYLFLLINTKDSLGRRLMNIPSTFTTNQIQQNFVGDFRIGKMRNRLLVGLDYTQLTTTDRRAMLNPFDKVKLNGNNVDISVDKYHQVLAGIARSQNKRFTQTYAAYISDVFNITPSLLAMASLRFSRFDNVDAFQQNSLSPKLGLVYQVVKDRLSLFGNYMNGYQNVAPGTTVESPLEPVALKPEQANQFEGGLKVELFGGKLNGTLSYYNIEVKDRVRTVLVQPNTSQPAISVSAQDATHLSKGFEADLIANPWAGFHIIFGYGYNDSKYTRAAAAIEGKRPYSTPEHVGNIWASYKLISGAARGLGFGIGGNYASDAYLDDANKITIPGYTKYDAAVFYDQSKFRLSLKLNNFTNVRYWSSEFWASPQATRQFITSLTYRF